MEGAKASERLSAERQVIDLEQEGVLVIHLRRILILTLTLNLGALYQIFQLANELGALPASWKWMSLLVLVAVAAIMELIILFATWTSVGGLLLHLLLSTRQYLRRNRLFNLIGLLILLGLLPVLMLGPYGRFFEGFLIRIFGIWCLGLLGATLLYAINKQRTWSDNLPLCLLLIAGVYRIAIFIPWVSTFPFSLGYSEGSRYYFASLFFGERIYAVSSLGWPVLHPSRYILQALPFLFGQIPIEIHRLWQVLLWIGMTVAAATLLIKRLSITDPYKRVLWITWAFLFMFQGPVYYHLQVIVIIVLWATDTGRFSKTMALVILASVWAGISRVNWYPVPGFLAATLYFLEKLKPDGISLGRYLIHPFLWVIVGSLVAFGSQAVYITLSGNQADWFASSVNSPLLWYRLLPSATNKTGVLLAILFASSPLVFLIVSTARRRPLRWHPIRLLGLGTILGVLLVGGLVVSTKIGGGDDLHNLDAFLVNLMTIGSYLLFKRFVQDQYHEDSITKPAWQVMALVLMVPILFVIGLGGPVAFPNLERANDALAQLRDIVRETTARGGNVLFLSERHLLTFGYIDGVELEHQYEKTFLMEMAMSDNREYFDTFDADLEAHRFALIVTNPQHIIYKNRDYTFGEEDDAWVRNVSTPLLKHYQNKVILDNGKARIAIMEPKP